MDKLAALKDDMLGLAFKRIALVPLTAEREAWRTLGPHVLADRTESGLMDCCAAMS